MTDENHPILNTAQMLEVAQHGPARFSNVVQNHDPDFIPKARKGATREFPRINQLAYLYFALRARGDEPLGVSVYWADQLFKKLEEQRAAIELLAAKNKPPRPTKAMIEDAQAKADARYVMFYRSAAGGLALLRKDFNPSANVNGVPVYEQTVVHLDHLERLLDRQIAHLNAPPTEGGEELDEIDARYRDDD